MNIKGLDYNTQREKLILPEYGREIQKMVDLACTLPTKDERLACARSIVKMMAVKVPHITANEGFEQTLWDHLYIMGRGNLDIDWPFDISGACNIMSKPHPMPIAGNRGRLRLRHYGRLLEETFELLQTMPDGPEKEELVKRTANQMKRDLATWGHGSMDDLKVADDLARYTNGAIQLDLNNFKFESMNNGNFQPGNKQQNKRKKK